MDGKKHIEEEVQAARPSGEGWRVRRRRRGERRPERSAQASKAMEAPMESKPTRAEVARMAA